MHIDCPLRTTDPQRRSGDASRSLRFDNRARLTTVRPSINGGNGGSSDPSTPSEIAVAEHSWGLDPERSCCTRLDSTRAGVTPAAGKLHPSARLPAHAD